MILLTTDRKVNNGQVASFRSYFSLYRPEHTKQAVTRRINKFHRVRTILSKIWSPQNFVTATCRTKLDWFNFLRRVAAATCSRDDKILTNEK